MIDDPGDKGELALEVGLAVDDARLSARGRALPKCFFDGWYLTGDLANRDADGYFWFVGRADDVIKSSGHLIGPFEVESALMDTQQWPKPAYRQARPAAGEIVKAFVALKPALRQARRCARNFLGLRARAWARRWRRRKSIFAKLAEDAQRKDHAPPLEGTRTRLAGRRSVDARE